MTATDIFSLGLIFTFMLFKTSNIPRIEQHLSAREAFGQFPGMLMGKELNQATERIVRKLERQFDISVGDLLKNMLQEKTLENRGNPRRS